MFGQNEALLREYYWTDTATMISALRIELIDQKRTALSVGEKLDNSAEWRSSFRLFSR